uniref:Uncharacterized protein n=1 Tax=Rhizophora mucronata TaxID=61149 RepID=A0A2P2K3P7_RHIMU
MFQRTLEQVASGRAGLQLYIKCSQGGKFLRNFPTIPHNLNDPCHKRTLLYLGTC